MGTIAARTELESKQLKSGASSKVCFACLEVRRHRKEECFTLHWRSPSLALHGSAEPVFWPVQAPASLAPPPVKRSASGCGRNERREVRVQLSRPRKSGNESNDPTQCSSGRKALRVLRIKPNLKHKFQYSSLQAKSVSASSQEPQVTARPNHFIEGTAKKLRFLSAPHVER
jgi:hypothetical protein